MSKVICDVCGTTFPETASVCPICGCAKNTTAQTAADSTQNDDTVTSYNYVKGGRFSKANVRKRNKKGKEFQRSSEQKSEQDGTNKGLIIVVLLLLLAIAAVLIYIGVRFFVPNTDDQPSGTGSTQMDNTGPSSSSTPTNPSEVSCTGLKLSSNTIELSAEGSVWLLSVEKEPANTTDTVTFTSANEQVATVSENGSITAVGGGETVITVTCGDVTAECKIVCTFGDPVEPSTDPTEPSVNIPEGFELKLNRKDFTLSKEGESWILFKDTDSVKASDITWTVDDPEVATVENGKVTGVDYGDTKVHATLGDQTVSCSVRVRFRATNAGGEGNEEGEATAAVKLSHTDVTIEVDETFMLTLTNSEGAKINVEWTASEEGFVTIDGSRITGLSNGDEGKVKRIEISTTYEGETYTCTVRVKAKAEE